MRKKKYTRIGAVTLAMMLTMQGTGTMNSVSAGDKITKVRSESQTQMSSEPEVVYVNTYNDTTKRSQNFDSNWKFYLGEAGDAQTPAFDDSRWRQISLPHDYSIEQEFSQAMEAESGYLPGGTGWYRKNFIVGEELEGKEIRIDFDGVYMNSTVWINGEKLGTHPYGYTPFSYNITDHVKFGEENTIAVKVDHKMPSSRWYSGSGIYRSVNLTVTDKVHVDLYGVKIETPNLKTEAGGTVNMKVKTNVMNASAKAQAVVLTHTVYKKGTEDSIGTVTTAAQEIAAGATVDIDATVPAAKPELWSPENAALYTVRTEVKVGNDVVDTYDTEYGFRYYAFDKNTGFSLNGENVKLKGVCMHHDQGSLGAVANRRAIERQVELLKEMGCNSIRVTHNPAASALIEICDEKGMIVIDEFFDGWHMHKNGNSNDYATWFSKAIEADNAILGKEDGMTWAEFDLKATIKRAWNAPSVIMWSLGNEIQEGAGGTGYSANADNLIRWARETDMTRLLTIGSNAVKNAVGNANNEHIQIGNKLTAVGGVSGTNYSNGASYDNLHATYPEWNILGSETASAVNSRGVYYKKGNQQLNADKQLTSYDKSAVGWGAFASAAWYDVIKRDFVAGEYVWTGFDYIGEPTPANGVGAGAVGAWPSPKNSFFGIIDTAGFPKDSYYLYQSMWNDDVNTLHILPTWNEDGIMKDGNGNVEVVVYSDAPTVELKLNGNVVGTQKMTTVTTPLGYTYQKAEGSGDTHTSLYRTFNVPYAAGTLEAVAKDEAGNVIENTQGRSVVKTTGNEAKLAASADRTEISADGKDLTYITVDVTDADGNIVPDAANRVKFTVEGEGVLVGVDNGSSPDHDSYKSDNRKAFSGKVLAIVQATKNAGTIKVTATAEGLEPAVVNVTTKAVDDGTTGAKQIDSFYMSKTYYVKAGNIPQLPETIETRYTDDSAAWMAVAWDEITAEQVAQAGGFTVKGQVEGGYTVAVNVNVIDEIGGVLNYSTTTPVGVKPGLPETRPVVMQDGTVTQVAFAVDWEEPADDVYNKAGTVMIGGEANVLGQVVEVTASVRVQEEQVTVGDSVSSAGYLSQDIPENMQSDTLDAIKDGSTVISDNTGGGANPSAWSNWKNSQSGNNKAELTFEYDTQQRLAEIVIHFAKDNGSMRFPDAGTTEIYISENGEEGSWSKVDAEEVIGTEANRVKPYTYKFTPIKATFIKFCLTNFAGATGTAQKACTAITEIELKEAKGAFVTNSTAEFDSLTVNDIEVPAANLEAGSYSTPALFADVAAEPKDNAALTVLPVYEDVIRVILESEDHNTRNVFEIKLNQESSGSVDDDSRDYPAEKCAAFADSVYSPGTANEGPARYVLDNNAGTYWHTNWAGVSDTPDDQLWIGITLEEATKIDALRYLPRGGNGDVRGYKVQYRETEDGEWKDISAGTWSRGGQEWKLAEFEHPVTAKQVRLAGTDTWTDAGTNKHMSAAEIRVRMVEDKIDVSKLNINVPAEVAAETVDAEHPVFVQVEVSEGEKALRYGYDYLLSYENNTAFGTASVTIKGIGIYGGTVTKTFTIKKAELEAESIFVSKKPTQTTYIEGEKFNPTGLVLTVVYNDQSTEEVSYNANEFAFKPGLDTALTTDMKKVTVTYKGKTADIDIIVNAKPVLDHIVAKTDSVKTTYTEGEKFNPAGLELTLVYSDGSEKTAVYAGNEKDFAFNPVLDAVLEAGEQIITVTYAGKTTDINISVEKVVVPTLDKIEISKAPEVTEYIAGESFDPDGLELKLVYSDGSEETVVYNEETAAGFTFDPAVGAPLTAGTTNVRVTYRGILANISITVEEAVDIKAELLNAIEAAEELKAVLDANPEVVTEESYKAFADALENAWAVYEDEDAAEEDVLNVLLDLAETIENLEFVEEPGEADKKDAQKFYDDCLAYYKEANHSEENWKAYMDAMKALKAVLDDEYATQDEVNAKLADLVKITKKMNVELDTGDVHEQPKEPDTVTTGDALPVGMMMLMMVMAVGSIMMVVRRRRIR